MQKNRSSTETLTTGDGSYDKKRLGARSDCCGKGRVRWFMGEIPCAGKKSQERPALERDLVANGAAQHGIAGFECVEDRTQRGLTVNLELHVAANMGQRLQMRRKHDGDHASAHGRVWTSTERTAGRSRTMGAQLSPAFADA